jgi:hypothetical protein
MTLTDEENQEMSQADERAREILERTESMPPEQLMKMHGVLRGLPGSAKDVMNEFEWQLLEDRTEADSVTVPGVELRKGDRVRLRPRAGDRIDRTGLRRQTAPGCRAG